MILHQLVREAKVYGGIVIRSRAMKEEERKVLGWWPGGADGESLKSLSLCMVCGRQWTGRGEMKR